MAMCLNTRNACMQSVLYLTYYIIIIVVVVFVVIIIISLVPQPSLGLGLLHEIWLNFLEASQQFSF